MLSNKELHRMGNLCSTFMKQARNKMKNYDIVYILSHPHKIEYKMIYTLNKA